MCPDCVKSTVNMEWEAKVQLRQKSSHRGTMMYLEQLILKHNAQRHTIGMQQLSGGGGLDFFFRAKNHANVFVDFVKANIAARSTHTTTLVSADNHSNIHHVKHTYSVEMVPICKDDLLILPKCLSIYPVYRSS